MSKAKLKDQMRLTFPFEYQNEATCSQKIGTECITAVSGTIKEDQYKTTGTTNANYLDGQVTNLYK